MTNDEVFSEIIIIWFSRLFIFHFLRFVTFSNDSLTLRKKKRAKSIEKLKYIKYPTCLSDFWIFPILFSFAADSHPPRYNKICNKLFSICKHSPFIFMERELDGLVANVRFNQKSLEEWIFDEFRIISHRKIKIEKTTWNSSETRINF